MNLKINKIFSFGYDTGEMFQEVAYEGYELTYFVTGRGYMLSGDKTIHYKPNTILFSTPEYVRKLCCIEKTTYYCIRFEMNKAPKDLGYGVYHCKDDCVLNRIKQILQEYKDKPYRYYDLCNMKVEELLILLARETWENVSVDKSIYSLIEEIDRSMDFERSVRDMANELNYSYDYFRHKFKRITGQSPGEYIANKRIENACKLLKQNQYTCTEIATLCGFASASQFSKLFKREIGLSPLYYQKS